MQTPKPELTPVKNGWHALARDWNLAVWGETEQDAREHFARAIRKAVELRERPEPASSAMG
jgi:hypothetical protein